MQMIWLFYYKLRLYFFISIILIGCNGKKEGFIEKVEQDMKGKNVVKFLDIFPNTSGKVYAMTSYFHPEYSQYSDKDVMVKYFEDYKIGHIGEYECGIMIIDHDKVLNAYMFPRRYCAFSPSPTKEVRELKVVNHNKIFKYIVKNELNVENAWLINVSKNEELKLEIGEKE